MGKKLFLKKHSEPLKDMSAVMQHFLIYTFVNKE